MFGLSDAKNVFETFGDLSIPLTSLSGELIPGYKSWLFYPKLEFVNPELSFIIVSNRFCTKIAALLELPENFD